MISALLFINSKGEMVISRFYRDDVTKATCNAFRKKVISEKNITSPVVHLDKCSFMYVRVNDLFLCAVTKLNANTSLVFSFLYKVVDIFKSYFGAFDEQHVRNNFVLVYELLDETMDNGYPQITATNILSSYIKEGTVNLAQLQDGNDEQTITSQITGAVDWRQPGKYKYRKNEVFIDAFEAVNLLMSNKGLVLKADVSGKIIMKTYLSGMPECKFGMNDKVMMEQEAAKKGKRKQGAGIAIDDITFHRCVNLSNFDTDRTISFTPPDGEFELMKYRITQNVNLPFRVIPVVTEHGRSRVEYEIKVKGNFSNSLYATGVFIRVPTPKNTAKCDIQATSGKTKYDPGSNCIIWKIKKFPGDASFILKGHVKLVSSMQEKQWSRPPITMDFQVPMFTSSGLHVRFMKVFEKSSYDTIKWVRYISKAGQYQIRI